MRFSALASGSSGNCFYLENGNSAILVDAGISCRQIKERLSVINRNLRNIKGIFITHEHSDHIKGADVLAREFQIPIFATKKTAENCFLCGDENLVNIINDNENLKLAGMSIEAFSKSHKAADPVSYSITQNKRASIITDVGHACKNVISQVKDSDFLCIESNHDIEMLECGPYPYFLKHWIKSDIGHLSNLQSALLVLEYGSKRLKNIVLSHLSKTNNTPLLALSTFNSLIKERRDLHPRVSISGREFPTGLINI